MGARYYHPVLGRFTGIDPVGYTEDNIHSHNRYTYANNNPYKFVDPDGREAEGIVGEKEAKTNQQLADTAKALNTFSKTHVETRATQLGFISTGLGLGGLVSGLRGVAGMLGTGMKSADLTVKTETLVTSLQFGKTNNQINHAFRHTDQLGLNRANVQAAIQNHFSTHSKNMAQLAEGKTVNNIVNIDGKAVQYSAHQIAENTFNIGRIHGIK
jgi:uncharacterized protein RhaS with RHS repeats